MKTKTLFTLLIAIVAVVVLTQCGGPKKDDGMASEAKHTSGSEESAAATGPQFEVDALFQEQLVRILQSYLKVKDAFVASDAALVKSEAGNLRKIVKAVDAKMISGPALNDWSNYSNNLEMALSEIAGTDDIEAQRTAFSALSENLYKSIKAYGLGTMTAYQEFCPMAFNDQGAYWISDSKEIRNPYFGDKMLTCGKVTEELN
jgi:Cu(I)/Ag(I) efflux system membrane fusion protein